VEDAIIGLEELEVVVDIVSTGVGGAGSWGSWELFAKGSALDPN